MPAWNSCGGVKFDADGWINPLNLDWLQMCSFALRPLARNLFDLVLPPGIHLQISHFCKETNTVLPTVLYVDYERFLAGAGGARCGEGVRSGVEMEGYKAPVAEAGQSLLPVNKPAAKGLPAFGKEHCTFALH
ncbi:MAG TPA: hypothetical protein VFA99_01955 [Acidobacteriaceae bacterium]|nr:hypothetical protein [Acidobacteriaceae bacterium]